VPDGRTVIVGKDFEQSDDFVQVALQRASAPSTGEPHRSSDSTFVSSR
jgi:hypothetical protein